MSLRYEIGEKIRDARKKKSLTQQQVSKRSGVNKTTISEIENGRFTGSFDIFERVLDQIGLEFNVVPKKAKLPDWDEIDSLFNEGDL